MKLASEILCATPTKGTIEKKERERATGSTRRTKRCQAQPTKKELVKMSCVCILPRRESVIKGRRRRRSMMLNHVNHMATKWDQSGPYLDRLKRMVTLFNRLGLDWDGMGLDWAYWTHTL
jgi:hypothetical protein